MSKKRKKKEEFESSFSDEGVVELPIPNPVFVYKKTTKAIPKKRNKTIELKRQKN